MVATVKNGVEVIVTVSLKTEVSNINGKALEMSKDRIHDTDIGSFVSTG